MLPTIISLSIVLGYAECNNCIEKGIFSADNPHEYFTCTLINGVLVKTEFDCGNEHFYSDSREMCVSEEEYQSRIRRKRQSDTSTENPTDGTSTENPTDGTSTGLTPSADESSTENPTLPTDATVSDDTTSFTNEPTTPSGTSAPAETPTRESCSEPGLLCSGCSTVQLCVSDGTNSSLFYSYECPYNQVCRKGKGCVRSSEGPANCTNTGVGCGSEGRFPDPFNCNGYINCVYNQANQLYEAESVNCTEGYYNTKLQSCGFNRCINVPRCRTENQIGVIISRLDQFYFCVFNENEPLTLTHIFFNCPTGTTFNPVTASCAL